MANRAHSLLVRTAQPADAVGLQRLQDQIYREGSWFVGDGPPGPQSLQRRLAGLDGRQSLYLVAVADDVLAGWLELHRLPASRMRHVATLTIAVAAAHRGRRVGTALLEDGLSWATKVGIRKITLNVRARNDRAIRLYRRFGFEVEGRERGQILADEGYEDSLIMARFLTS